jgi:hypothetical protein
LAEGAEQNINELLSALPVSYHRRRQATIDEELFDLIAGYEALRSQGPPHRHARERWAFSSAQPLSLRSDFLFKFRSWRLFTYGSAVFHGKLTGA